MSALAPIGGRVAVVSNTEAGSALADALEAQAVAVGRHASARDAMADAAGDVLLLAIDTTGGAPDAMDGIRHSREQGYRGPIVALVERGDWMSAVLALEMGADTILEAPLHARVAVAYARRVLRSRSMAKTIRAGTLEMHLPSRTARAAGHELDLTESEFDLLACLAERAGEPMTRAELLAATRDERLLNGRAVDTRICRLRARLAECGGPEVVTLRQRGYLLAS